MVSTAGACSRGGTLVSTVGVCSTGTAELRRKALDKAAGEGAQGRKGLMDLFSALGHHFRARPCKSTRWGIAQQKTLSWKC